MTTVLSTQNLASPTLLGSPESSGSLSPLNLSSPSESSESVVRTFKDAMRAKKTLRTSQSAFIPDEVQVLTSDKYDKFQSSVQHIKQKILEKAEQKGDAQKKISAPPPVPKLPKSVSFSVFLPITSESYFERFPIKKKSVKEMSGGSSVPALLNAHVGESVFSEWHRPVTAFDIGDSLAVFCLSQKHVFVHHISSGEDSEKAVSAQFARFPPDEDSTYKIYLAGGDESPESTRLLSNIKSVLPLFFGNRYSIQEFLRNRSPDKLSISVCCMGDKRLLFCHHD